MTFEMYFCPGLIIFGILAFLLIGIKIVRPIEMGVIERFGKFKNVAQQGFHWIIPAIDKMTKVNITERMADIKPRDMITKDNLNAKVDLVVYYRVKPTPDDVKKSIYNVDDYGIQIVSLAQTTARNVIGTMEFEEVNSMRSKLNEALEQELDKQTDAWGIQIVRVELQEISPPADVQETMNKIIKANNTKVAASDFAEAAEIEADGKKRAAIKEAEGTKQAMVLDAEGEAKAIVQVAEAKAREIELVNTSLQKHFKNEAQLYKRLETTEKSLEKGTKYIIGNEKDIQLVLSEAAGVIPLKPEKKDSKK